MLKGLKKWLANNRRFLFARYTEDSQETQEPERSLIELPKELKDKLVEFVESLPSNPAERDAIASAINETFESWQANPENSNNSIVILSSPVTTVSRILADTLDEWGKQKQVALRLVPLEARPSTADSIKSKLQHYLEEEFVEDNLSKKQSEVVVIPNLSWCFLRSLEGLEGIEYLQTRLCEGFPDRFWIIGAGQVGWEYLNSVCNLEAYCGKVFVLPSLNCEQLQDWFKPIVDDLAIVFDDPTLDKQILESDKGNDTNYFDRLAEISNGVTTVAVQAFLKSICYEEIEDEEVEDEEIEDEEVEDQEVEDKEHTKQQQQRSVIAKIPKLPELPELESSDLYLLYSLLLHGDLTISGLAESLGDDKSEVQARVQVLRYQGVIEQRKKVIKINPIYYPRVKQELASNNFVINKH